MFQAFPQPRLLGYTAELIIIIGFCILFWWRHGWSQANRPTVEKVDGKCGRVVVGHAEKKRSQWLEFRLTKLSIFFFFFFFNDVTSSRSVSGL